MPGTIPLNTKIAQGPRYGHFFLMPEDNLVSLYKGNEKAIGVDGTEEEIRALKNLVMIDPKEGSALNANPAAVFLRDGERERGRRARSLDRDGPDRRGVTSYTSRQSRAGLLRFRGYDARVFV